MKTILEKRANIRLIRRITAALLSIVMISNYVLPLQEVFADTKDDKDSWEAEYFMEVDGDVPVSEEDGILYLDVFEGEEVNFHMLLTEKSTVRSRRFKEDFDIIMPETLYELMTGNGELIKDGWLNYDDSESGYLLEVVDPDSDTATNSDATGSNATRSNSSRRREKEEAGMHKVTFRFVDELRGEKNPGDIQIEDAEGVLSFIAPEDARIAMIQDGNDLRIEMRPLDLQIRPLASTLDGMSIGLQIKQGGGALTDNLSWNPSSYSDETLITMRVTYESTGLNNYGAGDLEITLDGLTGNLSEYWTSYSGYELKYIANAEQWDYTYDSGAAQFTFTNKEAVDNSTNFQGYFEITWTVTGKLKADDYEFEAVLNHGSDSINSETCKFTMVKDSRPSVNTINKSAVGPDDMEMMSIYKSLPADRDDYYWVRYKLSRTMNGYYDTMMMEYKISDTFPANVKVFDSSFSPVTLNGNTYELTVNKPSAYSTYDTYLYVAYPKLAYTGSQIVTNEFSVTARYEDETNFVLQGKGDCSIPLKAFDFTYNGDMYGIQKSRSNSYSYINLSQVRYHHLRPGVTNTNYDPGICQCL